VEAVYHGCLQMDVKAAWVPSLRIQRALSHKNDLALADIADAIGHFLRVFDGSVWCRMMVHRSRADAVPWSHISRRSSTSTPAVGLIRRATSASWEAPFGDQHPPFMQPEEPMIFSSNARYPTL